MQDPTVPYAILVYPALLATIVLFARIALVFGKRWAFFFIWYGAAFFWAKEVLQSNRVLFEHMYSLPKDSSVLSIFGTPVIVVVGYIFTFGLCLSLGTRILKNLNLPRNIPYLMTLMCILSSVIAYAIEMGAITAGWWDWGDGITPWWNNSGTSWMGDTWFFFMRLGYNSTGDVPSVALGGWFDVMFYFVAPIMYMQAHKKPGDRLGPSLGFILLFPFMLFMGRTAVCRSIIFLIPFILLHLEGIRENGNKDIFQEKAVSTGGRSPGDLIIDYGDYAACAIFLLVIMGVELYHGLQAQHVASWLPFLICIIMAAVQNRGRLLLLCGAIFIMGWGFSMDHRTSIWTSSVKIMYFGICTVGILPTIAYIIHEWRYGKKAP